MYTHEGKEIIITNCGYADDLVLYSDVKIDIMNVINKYGDWFPSCEIQNKYKTLEGLRIFKNHKMDNIDNALGIVTSARLYNNSEHSWIECLLEIDLKKDPDFARGIEKGYITDFSLPMTVDYSVCSCCGNKAYTEEEYCECIKCYRGKDHCLAHKGEIREGIVYNKNYGVTFLGISFEYVNSLFGFEKVANEEVSYSLCVED